MCYMGKNTVSESLLLKRKIEKDDTRPLYYTVCQGPDQVIL